MDVIFRNKLLAEYSRADLEEEFIRCCEELDQKAKEINKLENQSRFYDKKFDRLNQDIEDLTKVPVCFDGAHAPTAFRQSQAIVKKLQDQISELEIELAQKQAKRNRIADEVKYFKSLLSFPAKRLKNTTKTQKKTVDELIKMLTYLLTHNLVEPEMIPRVEAAIEILKRNFEAAISPLRELADLFGLNCPLFDVFDKLQEIKDRDSKIEALRQKLAELRQRNDEMAKEHQRMLEQYKEEADQNSKKYKDMMNMQNEKEVLEADLTRLQELQIILNGLKNEIKLIEEQIEKLKKENEENAKRLKGHLEESVNKLLEELKALIDHNTALRASNSNIQKEEENIEKQYGDARDRALEIEKLSQQLQNEYMSLRTYFTKMLSGTNRDPFENKKFEDFLIQMSNKEWKFETIQQYNDDIEQLNVRKDLITEKLEKYETIQTTLQDKLKSISQVVSSMESTVAEMQLDNAKPPPTTQEVKQQDYLECLPHVQFNQKQVVELADDETAIMLTFLDFHLADGLIRSPKSKIFLVIDFYTNKSQSTTYVSPSDGTFDCSVMFPCVNDSQLRDYVEHGTVQVQLYAARGVQYDEIGSSEFSIQPFANGIDSFASKFTLKSKKTNKEVGTVEYEAQLYIPLIEK
ncbi:hypothetical protein GPJ56_005138 [Histomonas meleagridis]|uniref:uncharacterized protein n=1 Tax=Histomonas meleagridis TaxID=135588 RepID=UPI00355A18AC|nr:hypothetical protein GPJ56_005138 [Histomonas meleagridis]KAH0802655.1 hypothetical protein GO595_004704 [Histomonas meleagridis]